MLPIRASLAISISPDLDVMDAAVDAVDHEPDAVAPLVDQPLADQPPHDRLVLRPRTDDEAPRGRAAQLGRGQRPAVRLCCRAQDLVHKTLGTRSRAASAIADTAGSNAKVGSIIAHG
jgi:hypothetical protein